MTLRSAICFNALIFLMLSPLQAGAISGQVELTNSRDPAVHRHKDYSGVVLWFNPVGKTAAPVSKTVKMAQRNKHFIPHVVAIPVGGTVDFPNFDEIFHNAFSNFSGQPFDVGLYPPKTSRAVTFKQAGIVRVFCNIHSNMSAIIAVVPTPYYVVTTDSGKFSIPEIPAGSYDLQIFHERALPENLNFLDRRITVPEGGLTLPLISISETGYTPEPHMNKYGKQYPKNPGIYKDGQ